MNCSVRIHTRNDFPFFTAARTGGGFEGDMILPDGFDPTKEPNEKGVAIFGPRRWPDNVVPYDIALITGRNAGKDERLSRLHL